LNTSTIAPAVSGGAILRDEKLELQHKINSLEDENLELRQRVDPFSPDCLSIEDSSDEEY
jgi:hypothetical protein